MKGRDGMPQVEIMNEIADIVGLERVGMLTPEADFAANFAGGKTVKNYLDGSELCDMQIQISGKSTDQNALAERLCGICDLLTRKNFRTFKRTENWEIRKISVGTPPAPKGFDGTVWYYACVLSVQYFLKK